MDYNTSTLCDVFADSVDVVEPMFVSFGGRASYGGEITTIKCFEDKGLVLKTLEQPGLGKISGNSYEVTQNGINSIKNHISFFARLKKYHTLACNTQYCNFFSIGVIGSVFAFTLLFPKKL